jgi:glycosyltransferase involved in cell wall biosynthesis
MVCVAPGPPFAAGTWSGISRRLLAALDAEGALASAVAGRPAAMATLEKAASFSPVTARWRQHYNTGTSPLSPLLRAALSALAGRRARRAAGDANVLLQFTGWYGPGRSSATRLHCAYHDGNLAAFLRRPDLALDPRSRAVRRALDSERRLAERTDVIFPMSEWLRRSFVEDYGQPAEKVVAVGAGPGFETPPGEVERDFTRPRFLFVGKDFERKGGPQLLRAFREVRAERPDAELRIVGPLDSPPEQPGVLFVGRLDRSTRDGAAALDAAFRISTAFAMPSLYEPFGLVFLEAMAYRLPCLAAASCAMPEIVEDGVSGYVVPPEDPDRLAERLLDLTDGERACVMGEAGHRRFLERYTWPAVARRIIETVRQRLSTCVC